MTSVTKPGRPRPTIELGETIRDRRELQGLSMQATATQAGISVGYQYKLEGGFVRTPSPRVLSRLSVVLDLSYPDLMRLAGYPGDIEVGTPGASLRRMTRDRSSQAKGGTPMSEAPTNRGILRLLEEMQRDLAALRADVARLSAIQSSPPARPAPPKPE
jgi:transcriptional regulator with XRE-family HTH domain